MLVEPVETPEDMMARAVLANPFTPQWLVARRELARILRSGGDMSLVTPRLQSGQHEAALRMVLATRFVRALDDTPGKDAADGGPRAWYRAVGLDKDRVDRLIHAAVACRQRILKIKGRSSATAALQRDVWAATLGSDLAEGDPLTPYLRRTNVLVHGETGTGKELVAKAVLWGTPAGDPGESKKAASTAPVAPPKVMVNVAELHEQTVESTLFGHERGAFSGATRARRGLVREAHLGALFLDEIGELPLHLQAKLLRVMQEREVLPLGADVPTPADVRYVVATHQPVSMDGARFRADFLQRAAGVVLEVPPLRDRKEDVPDIAEAMLADAAVSRPEDAILYDVIRPLLSDQRFLDYDWPGNVRELEVVIRRFLLLRRVELGVGTQAARQPVAVDVPAEVVKCTWTEDRLCRWYAARAAREPGLTRSALAARLGIERGTLNRRLAGGHDDAT